MRPGGGKAKGAEFERKICVQLSQWVTAGARDDVFWRSAMSGGRATVRGKQGKQTLSQGGDISCVSREGHYFLSRFSVECKHVANLNIQAALIHGTGPLATFWQQAIGDALNANKQPFLIAQQNRLPTLVFIRRSIATDYFGMVSQIERGRFFRLEGYRVSMFLLKELLEVFPYDVLVSADLHITDNPRDEYRWDLFPWLGKQVVRYGATSILLLGDITDAKDKHSSALTNRLVEALPVNLANAAPVIILRGNHDYIDERQPFFGFMRETKTKYGIQFLTEPTKIGGALFLPNTRNYEQAWVGLDFKSPTYIFTHQTYDGCLTENGTQLDGIPPSVFAKTKARVISGDIHVPQKISKNIEYVGAPYRIRFGDSYKPRVLLIGLDSGGEYQQQDLHFPTMTKHLVELSGPETAREAVKAFRKVEETGGLPICAYDQVKVRVRLSRSAFPDWPAIKAALIEEVNNSQLVLTGPELVAEPETSAKLGKGSKLPAGGQTGPWEALTAYAKAKGLPDDLKAAGKGFLKKAIGE